MKSLSLFSLDEIGGGRSYHYVYNFQPTSSLSDTLSSCQYFSFPGPDGRQLKATRLGLFDEQGKLVDAHHPLLQSCPSFKYDRYL